MSKLPIQLTGYGAKVTVSSPPVSGYLEPPILSGKSINDPTKYDPTGCGYGLIQSGYIDSEQIGTYYLTSGALISGAFIYNPKCRKCGDSVLYKPSVSLNNIPLTTLNSYVCAKCAGFDINKNDFRRREDWIMEELNCTNDMPLEILADLCEQNYRSADAAYLRKLVNERQL